MPDDVELGHENTQMNEGATLTYEGLFVATYCQLRRPDYRCTQCGGEALGLTYHFTDMPREVVFDLVAWRASLTSGARHRSVVVALPDHLNLGCEMSIVTAYHCVSLIVLVLHVAGLLEKTRYDLKRVLNVDGQVVPRNSKEVTRVVYARSDGSCGNSEVDLSHLANLMPSQTLQRYFQVCVGRCMP